jgi:hypothetical protein
MAFEIRRSIESSRQARRQQTEEIEDWYDME